jgi:hypothetical protein
MEPAFAPKRVLKNHIGSNKSSQSAGVIEDLCFTVNNRVACGSMVL